MALNFTLPEIPQDSVLGLNYSGAHDTAIAIVAPDGKPVFAVSLERLSRQKQDGRWPTEILTAMPWQKISQVAISTEAQYTPPQNVENPLGLMALPQPRKEGLQHAPAFAEHIAQLPVPKTYVCHQLAHAASSFWSSGFEEALCLTYDGGMFNSPWFGGLYQANRQEGITPLTRFSALHYAKITSLYTFVTALLGFTPNKHEGKITGLAANGKVQESIRKIYMDWFQKDYFAIEATMEWAFLYDDTHPQQLLVNDAAIAPFRDMVKEFRREDLAATIQAMAEEHVLELLKNAKQKGWQRERICLAGGLFSNVKINQRIAESGFTEIFVVPPMTDEGTALGAAWQALVEQKGSAFQPKQLQTVALGPSYSSDDTADVLKAHAVIATQPDNAAVEIAQALKSGKVVAVYQGACEFGPRALGYRSLLAPANDPAITQRLNDMLSRTDFMPFAPITKAENADQYYSSLSEIRKSAAFMTVTANCTDKLKNLCPAVVHVDGTARPQLISAAQYPFLHAILTHYEEATGLPALVNTSFNIHEEPIVCSPIDALKGFFQSGIDLLYLDGYLVDQAKNAAAAAQFLRRIKNTSTGKMQFYEALQKQLSDKNHLLAQEMEAKEAVIQYQATAINDLNKQIEEKELFIQKQYAVTVQLVRTSEILKLNLEDELKKLHETISHSTEMKNCIGTIEQYLNDFMLKQQAIEKGLPHRPLNTYGLSLDLCANRLAIRALNRLIYMHDSFKILRKPAILAAKILGRLEQKIRPRLGRLIQHAPVTAILPEPYVAKTPDAQLPSFSIVTPSFRQADFIERTMLSILDQNYPKLEYFVQDGGSQDGTVEILERYADRLAGWVSEKDDGQSQAINLRLQKTTGEIMAWLNSDDLLLPGSLHYVADYFAQHPEVDVVYGHRLLMDEEDREIGRWVMPPHQDEVLKWADYIPQETMFWRRRIWEKAGGQIDESFRFAMDWDLIMRFRDAGAKFERLPRFLGAFRIHAAQKTSAQISEVGYREMDRIRERVLGHVPTWLEIRKAIMPYLMTHVFYDIAERIKLWQQKKKN